MHFTFMHGELCMHECIKSIRSDDQCNNGSNYLHAGQIIKLSQKFHLKGLLMHFTHIDNSLLQDLVNQVIIM